MKKIFPCLHCVSRRLGGACFDGRPRGLAAGFVSRLQGLCVAGLMGFLTAAALADSGADSGAAGAKAAGPVQPSVQPRGLRDIRRKAKKTNPKPSFSEASGPKLSIKGGAGRRSAAPTGRQTKVSFDKAMPEDITSGNFPDVVNGFNFPSAGISDLTKAIGKLTGMNFILPPQLEGKKITVIAPSKITVAEAYKAFLSALSINNLTVVKSGAFWKILPTSDALKDNTEVYSGAYFPISDHLITRVIRLRHIAAKEFIDSVKFLLGKSPQITKLESSNTVIVSDYGSAIEKLMKVLREIDIPGSEEGIEIIPIQYASAGDLAGILESLLFSRPGSRPVSAGKYKPGRRYPPPRFSSAGKKQRGNVKISRILPDLRTNSLVISANKEGADRVRRLVKKLDTYVDPIRDGGIYVYNVLYGAAEELYNTIMGISPSRRKPSAKSGGSAGGSGRRPPGPRYAPSRFGKKKSPLFESVDFMVDHNTNSLIISAQNKYDLERAKAMLKKLDTPRDQVFVQAVIVEMEMKDNRNWDINLAASLSDALKNLINSKDGKFFEFLTKPGHAIAGFLNTAISPQTILQGGSGIGPGFVLGLPLANLLFDLGGGESDADDDQYRRANDILLSSASDEKKERAKDVIESLNRRSRSSPDIQRGLQSSYLPLVRLLKATGNTNILSTPQITALDNTEATINVSENAPVSLTSSTGANSVFTSSVQRQKVGITLSIIPRINPNSGTIQMIISQNFGGISSSPSPAAELRGKAVSVLERSIKTEMVLNDGETAVMGGLITDFQETLESKVPFLGDIPLLGWLFKGSEKKKQKRNLVVFITPRIIRGADQKNQSRLLLEEKLEERINFIKKRLKGKDPQGEIFQKLQSRSSFGPAGAIKPEEGESDPAEASPAEEELEPDLEAEAEFSEEDQAFAGREGEEAGIFGEDEEGSDESFSSESEGGEEGESESEAGEENESGDAESEGAGGAFTNGFVPFGPAPEDGLGVPESLEDNEKGLSPEEVSPEDQIAPV